jgi:hypothetical protein
MGQIIPRGGCDGANCPQRQLSWGKLSPEAAVMGQIVPGGSCDGEIVPGSNCDGTKCLLKQL